MKAFSSLTAVIGLWLGVSLVFWAAYRLVRRRSDTQQRRKLDGAIALIEEAGTIFQDMRGPQKPPPGGRAFLSGSDDERLRENVRQLLNAIEAKSTFFDTVNASKRGIAKAFGIPDFLPLGEILQIRRDFWASAEVFLMEDIRSLGAELADSEAYETFRQEAHALLFADTAAAVAGGAASADPVILRLSLAKQEAVAFKAEIIRNQEAERERSKMPRPAEVIAVPVQIVVLLSRSAGEIRYFLDDFVIAARTLARSMSTKGLRGAVDELRRAREELPSQFASAFERAGGLTQAGGAQMKRHYEFLIEARELRARYAELLARTPQITEKGRQFVNRLELERRAEQFRETSGDVMSLARQKAVVGIAYMIAGLQILQAKVTPPENKQLVLKPAEPAAPSETPRPVRPPVKEEIALPLRALLPPPGAAHPRRAAGRYTARPRAETVDATAGQTPYDALNTLRDREKSPIRTASRGRNSSSLLDRLSSVDDTATAGAPIEEPGPSAAPAPGPAPQAKGFRMFRGKR